MSKAKQFLANIARNKDNIFFSAINYKRAVELRNRKNTYSWESVNYKLYPSSVKSLYSCPKKFIEVTVQEAPDFQLPSIYKMEIGKIVHEMYQEEGLSFDLGSMEELLNDVGEAYLESLETYIRWMYKREAAASKGRLLWERPRKLSDMLEEKMSKSWPEIPGFCEESGFSFRSDLVLDYNDTPAVLDLKTTSVDPKLWEDKKEELPSKDHETQVRFYRYFFNRDKYFEKPIEWVGLGYINLLMPAGSKGSEHEVYKHMGKEVDKEIEDYVIHSARHRNAWIDGRRLLNCEYPLCNEHRKV